MNTILQVPVKKDLREQAQLAAEKLGFSSLQEPVRIFLKQLALGNVKIAFEQEVQLSEMNKKRYEKMVEDIEKERVKMQEFPDADSVMSELNK